MGGHRACHLQPGRASVPRLAPPHVPVQVELPAPVLPHGSTAARAGGRVEEGGGKPGVNRHRTAVSAPLGWGPSSHKGGASRCLAGIGRGPKVPVDRGHRSTSTATHRRRVEGLRLGTDEELGKIHALAGPDLSRIRGLGQCGQSGRSPNRDCGSPLGVRHDLDHKTGPVALLRGGEAGRWLGRGSCSGRCSLSWAGTRSYPRTGGRSAAGAALGGTWLSQVSGRGAAGQSQRSSKDERGQPGRPGTRLPPPATSHRSPESQPHPYRHGQRGNSPGGFASARSRGRAVSQETAEVAPGDRARRDGTVRRP